MAEIITIIFLVFMFVVFSTIYYVIVKTTNKLFDLLLSTVIYILMSSLPLSAAILIILRMLE